MISVHFCSLCRVLEYQNQFLIFGFEFLILHATSMGLTTIGTTSLPFSLNKSFVVVQRVLKWHCFEKYSFGFYYSSVIKFLVQNVWSYCKINMIPHSNTNCWLLQVHIEPVFLVLRVSECIVWELQVTKYFFFLFSNLYYELTL